jgi:hypothetical protein
MSTIPFTLIEGAIAMPRLRPLRHVPTSFGRDWTLRPPAPGWRAELKALYAAVLHTFCLTDRAILSFCKWIPLDARRAAADLASSAPTVRRATADAAPREDARMVADGAVRSTTIDALAARAPNSASIHWVALAGGACAIGGVAMLAWVAFGHPEHRESTGNVKTADVAVISRESQLAKRPENDPVAAVKTDIGDAGARARGATLARVDAKPVVAPASVVTPASAPNNVSRDKASSQRTTTRSVVANQPRGVAATRHHTSRTAAVPPTASRKSPAPSVAGDYSPFAPAELGVDEYAAIRMSAATHLRDIVAGPHAPTSGNPSEAGGTQWMDRMSHRRVTEVPEQFSK